MTADVPSWNIALSAAPRIIILGTAIHGERQLTESYHSHFWVLLAFHYEGEVVVDEHVMQIRPGHVGVFPPGATITIRYRGRSMHRYAHLALRAGRPDQERPIAAMHDLGPDAAKVDAACEAAIRAYPTVPERSSSIFWDLLWQLVERSPSVAARQGGHPALVRARELIELGLAEPLRIEDLAAEAGVTARHLGNLFHAAQGCSVRDYIRDRRMERAGQLLRRTRQPIARIAADVGLPDLQHFNKVVRRSLGKSPREVREGG